VVCEELETVRGSVGKTSETGTSQPQARTQN
jgi:hypothetical protein